MCRKVSLTSEDVSGSKISRKRKVMDSPKNIWTARFSSERMESRKRLKTSPYKDRISMIRECSSKGTRAH
jgi:hypothetical protein